MDVQKTIFVNFSFAIRDCNNLKIVWSIAYGYDDLIKIFFKMKTTLQDRNHLLE